MRYISLFILSLFFLLPFQVHAESISLDISPSVINIIAKPGSSPTFSYTLENKGDPLLVKLKAVNFTTADNQGHPSINYGSKTTSVFKITTKNIKFNEPFLVRTNQKQRIELKMEIPENAPAQDYYYTLLASTSPFPTKEGDTTIDFSTTVGSNILVSVTSETQLETKAAITLFRVPVKYKLPFLSGIPIYDSFDSVPLILSLKNTGRNYISPKGTVTINGIGKQNKYSILTSSILSESEKLITIDESCAEDCFKDTSMTLQGVFLGKYTVSTDLYFYPGSSYIYASTSFIAFPFKLSAVTIFGLIAIYALKRRLKN